MLVCVCLGRGGGDPGVGALGMVLGIKHSIIYRLLLSRNQMVQSREM